MKRSTTAWWIRTIVAALSGWTVLSMIGHAWADRRVKYYPLALGTTLLWAQTCAYTITIHFALDGEMTWWLYVGVVTPAAMLAIYVLAFVMYLVATPKNPVPAPIHESWRRKDYFK